MTSSTSNALKLGLAAIALALLVAGLLLSRTHDRAPEIAAAAAPDSVSPEERAAAGLDRCGGLAATEKVACYEPFVLEILRATDVRHAMETLRALGAADRDVQRDGHVYAHAIGIAAYHDDPDVGRTFGACIEIYQSGCYHGVIQAYFGQAGRIDAAAVNDLCRAYKRPEDRWLLFQCVHGMGHGLTMVHDHDLPRALAGCDLLSEEWDRRACYGGAFMENIVNATMPHHPAVALGGDSAAAHGTDHGGSHAAHGGQAAAPAFVPLDPDDPLYPCNVLGEKYQIDCYQMQTSAILFHNGGDMEATARACDRAPVAMRPYCYQSLGRDITSYVFQDHAEGIRLCSLGDPRWQPWCIVGLVKNYVDLTAKTDDGFAFCRAVPGAASKMKCYEALGEQIYVLETTDPGRAAACARSEPEHLDACRYGARLTTTRPAGLPTEPDAD